MTTTLFLLFTASMAGIVSWLGHRYLGGRATRPIAITLAAWLAYVGLTGYAGLIGNSSMRPPGMIFLFAPVAVFLGIFVVRTYSAAGRNSVAAVPLAVLLGLQGFRVIVELFIHQLWIEGLVPKMLTYSGANVDIYVGATAPIVAWLSTRWKRGTALSVIWNVAGLLVLANVVTRAVLTAPGPLHLLHAEVPNRMIGTFPFLFIPGFFVPLAVVLHVAALSKATATAGRANP